MRFLETITFFGNDVLVPIDRIRCINYSAKDGGYVIKIHGEGDWMWEEHFDEKDSKRADERYKMIKEIVQAK